MFFLHLLLDMEKNRYLEALTKIAVICAIKLNGFTQVQDLQSKFLILSMNPTKIQSNRSKIVII